MTNTEPLDLDRIEARVESLRKRIPTTYSAPKWQVHATIPTLVWTGIAGYSDVLVAPSPEMAEFIAHAREDVPALIAEVRRLRAVNAIATADPCWGCDHAPHGIVCSDDCPCAIATLEENR